MRRVTVLQITIGCVDPGTSLFVPIDGQLVVLERLPVAFLTLINLGQGEVAPPLTDDVVDAILYLADARCITAQTIVIDSGQRFMGLERDVQFLGEQ